MPVRTLDTPLAPAPPPVSSKQPGVSRSLLYNGSRFVGHQRSKGNQYDVEVILQVKESNLGLVSGFQPFLTSHTWSLARLVLIRLLFSQHVDLENSFLCGYLKIKGLTEEYPTLTTFFDGEIISQKHPFLTRKWDADEDVDKKHWVGINCDCWRSASLKAHCFVRYTSPSSSPSTNTPKTSTRTPSITPSWRRRTLSSCDGRSTF